MNTSTNIVTRISPIPSSAAVQLLVEDTDTNKRLYSKTFEDTDDCQDFIKKYDNPKASISHNLIEALDDIQALYNKYNDDALLDCLLKYHTCAEVTQMMHADCYEFDGKCYFFHTF